MKIRKDLIVVALATFCLTATLFMVVLTRSADDPNWDPWVDIKEDGTVDIYDAITLANAYGTSGDTTKNVNVVNLPSVTVIGRRVNVTWFDYGTSFTIDPDWPTFETSGYSRMSIQLSVVDWNPHPTTPYFTTITAVQARWSIDPNAPPYSVDFSPQAHVSWPMSSPTQTFTGMTSKTNEIIGPKFSVFFTMTSEMRNGWALLDLYVYMRNE